MNIKIISKRTGLGNQIKFIPHIRELQNQHYVYTDSYVYSQLGIIEVDNITMPDVCYLVYNYRRNWVIKERMKYPKADIYGYIGSKSKIVKLFLNGYRTMDHNNTEIWNNSQFIPTNEQLYLNDWMPDVNTVALINSNKWNKRYKNWNDLITLLLQNRLFPRLFGDKHLNCYYIHTPTLKDLREQLRTCEYYIGTDNGGTQLAAALGIPGLTIWGDSKLRGIPINTHIIMGLDTSPTEIYQIFKEKIL